MSPRVLWRACLLGVVLVEAAPCEADEPARQWHALPVEGGVDRLAQAAGLEPGLPSWRALYEACRRRHGLWGEDAGSAPEAQAAPPRHSVVPLPLAPDVWRRLVRGGDKVSDEQLPLAILAERRSALLYRGLAAYDDETLAALAADPDRLRRLQRRHADVLAVFGARFAVRGGLVVVPGGPEAEPLWQELVGETPRSPARFLLALVGPSGGRLAFFYDSVARLEPVRQRLALGLHLPAGAPRTDAVRALARVFQAEAAWWRKEGGAFARPDADAARLLRELRLTPDGGIAPPTARGFWEALLDGASRSADEIRASPPVDVAWLAERIGTGDPRTRRLRLEQVSFAQRVFGPAAEASPLEAVQALHGLEDVRTLLLSLERMGARDPGFFATVVQGARRSIAASGQEKAWPTHAGFQGVVAVIDRGRFTRALDLASAERLLRSLLEVPLSASVPWERGLGGWLEATLLPELARALGAGSLDADTTVVRALAGATALSASRGALFEWEGLWYRAQPARAELRRIEGVRRQQGGASLGGALRGCRGPAEKGREACATAVAAALTSLVYAAHLGEPDGPALAGEDPARRHAFFPDPWALPEEVSGPGVPWHVRGSLLGLEMPLARLGLHRLAGDALPDHAPVIDAPQRRRLAVSVGLANAAECGDAERDALAGAVAAGRRRAAALRAGGEDVAPAARDAGLDPWRARALEWLLAHEPEARESFFSLGELLYLGAPGGGPWDAWGASDTTLAGLRLRLPSPRPLDEASGRRPEPALAEGFLDLGVRVAVHLAERGLPASLAPALVATLLPDLFVEARPVAPDDRLALDAWVRGQKATRLDDAVASLAGRGPLQPASAPPSRRGGAQ
jgi:hypothetical protein